MADWDTAFLASIKARTGPATPNGCLPWSGAIDKQGHCRVTATVDKVHCTVIVLRFLWDYNHPTEQIGGLHMCQRNCGNKQCVNVDHLQRVPRKKDFDAEAAWERLLEHGVRQDNGCLLANAPYRSMKLGENNMGLHKAAYMLHHKLAVPPPERDEGDIRMVIRHLCNNPCCFEPTHLAYGTQFTNDYEDKIANGTLQRGVKHYNVSITEELARQIKTSRPTTKRGQSGHETQKKRAHRFGVSLSIVKDIDRGRCWTHLSQVADATGGRRVKARGQRARAKARVWTDKMYKAAHQRLKAKLTITPNASPHVNTPCHIWCGANNFGYGRMSAFGKMVSVHILACEIKLGRPLEPGQIVRHLCGNKCCCAPDHLEPGTPSENSIDTVKHGSNVHVKLTEDQVRDIRATRGKDGLTQVKRAKKYAISLSNLWSIELRKSWKHVV